MHTSDLPPTYANYPTNDLIALWEQIRTEGILPELQAPRQMLIAMKGLLYEYGIVSWPISQPWKVTGHIARHVRRISFFSEKS